jgi:hypothetical protein
MGASCNARCQNQQSTPDLRPNTEGAPPALRIAAPSAQTTSSCQPRSIQQSGMSCARPTSRFLTRSNVLPRDRRTNAALAQATGNKARDQASLSKTQHQHHRMCTCLPAPGSLQTHNRHGDKCRDIPTTPVAHSEDCSGTPLRLDSNMAGWKV